MRRRRPCRHRRRPPVGTRVWPKNRVALARRPTKASGGFRKFRRHPAGRQAAKDGRASAEKVGRLVVAPPMPERTARLIWLHPHADRASSFRYRYIVVKVVANMNKGRKEEGTKNQDDAGIKFYQQNLNGSYTKYFYPNGPATSALSKRSSQVSLSSSRSTVSRAIAVGSEEKKVGDGRKHQRD
uniref:Uncharacterized protein n=1 Tax=Plectus sambesii TaxID=2011161 RepID=A0A914W4S2_9BILA